MRFPRLIVALVLLSLSFAARADDARPVIPLWPKGAPGSEAKKDLPEKVVGLNISGIHNPSLIVYLPPKEKATGVAVIIAPGGGHSRLVMKGEGYGAAQWFVDRGIAAFILKYRLAKDDANSADSPQPYTIQDHALADGQRAVRLIRSRAAEWGIKPDAIGIIGFSAGGEVAAFTAMSAAPGDVNAPDPIERQSARPDYQGLIYPGKSPLILPVKGAPPAFLACGFGDRQDISEGLAEVYLRFKRAGVPAELHIYSGAGHGFGVNPANKTPAGAWTDRFREWLVDQKFIVVP